MKITVCIATRNRAAAAIGVVMALHRMKTGDHEVQFILGLDNDDQSKELIVEALSGTAPITLSVADSPITRGWIENRMLKLAFDMGCDAATLMTDRTFNITPEWDQCITPAINALPNRVLWWSCPEDAGCVIPIIPRSYLQAINCQWDECVHPFWWSDTYQQEIDLMLHGMPSLKVPAYYSGSRGYTQNGRDFEFWLRVFIAMRPRRRAQAKKIGFILDIKRPDQAQVEDYFMRYDASLLSRCPQFEERFGDRRPPGPNYLTAKAKAETLLKELNYDGQE